MHQQYTRNQRQNHAMRKEGNFPSANLREQLASLRYHRSASILPALLNRLPYPLRIFPPIVLV